MPLLGGVAVARWAVLALFLTAQQSGQSWPMNAGPLATGTRVRITAPDVSKKRAVGWVDHWTADSLLVRRDPGPWATGADAAPTTLSYPRSSITLLETSQGLKGHAVRGAAFGFLVGSAAGLLVGSAAASSGYSDSEIEIGIAAWAGTAVVCAILGGFLGASQKTERWKEVGGL
jgi:hypothetical protein